MNLFKIQLVFKVVQIQIQLVKIKKFFDSNSVLLIIPKLQIVKSRKFVRGAPKVELIVDVKQSLAKETEPFCGIFSSPPLLSCVNTADGLDRYFSEILPTCSLLD